MSGADKYSRLSPPPFTLSFHSNIALLVRVGRVIDLNSIITSRYKVGLSESDIIRFVRTAVYRRTVREISIKDIPTKSPRSRIYLSQRGGDVGETATGAAAGGG